MRVGEQPLAGLAWYLRPFFWLQRRRWGQVLLPALTWARVPSYYLALIHFYAAIERKRSPLEPALRALLQTRISQLNHCAFCVDLNAMIAAQRAASVDKALGVAHWRTDPAFSPRERLAIEYAEAVTEGRVTEELSARARTEFGENGLVELTGLAAFQNLSAKFNAALDIPSQGFCKAPESK